jgi:hypothetical protein
VRGISTRLSGVLELFAADRFAAQVLEAPPDLEAEDLNVCLNLSRENPNRRLANSKRNF